MYRFRAAVLAVLALCVFASRAHAQAGPLGGTVRAIAVDPSNDAIVYAGTEGGGVFKSANGGLTWSAASNGLTSPYVQALAVDPVNPGVVYAATNGGIYKSSNGGGIWVHVNPNASNALVVDPTAPGTIYATGNGVIKSSDGGLTWTAQGSALAGRSLWSLAIDRSNPATVYAGTIFDGIFKTTDGGVTWSPSGLPTNVWSIATDPNSVSTVYAATDSGLLKSTDGGLTWVPKSFITRWSTVAVDPANSMNIYAGSFGGGGIYASVDGGNTWTLKGTGLTASRIESLVIAGNAGALYVGARDTGVFRSTDEGLTWTTSTIGLTALNVRSLSFTSPTATGKLLAGTSGGGVFRRADSATGWLALNSGLQKDIRGVVVDPSDSNIMYAVVGSLLCPCGVYKSTDGGANWTLAVTGLTDTANDWALAIDPIATSTLYLATTAGVFKSIDGAATWTASSAGITSLDVRTVVVDPSNPLNVYVAGIGGVFKSIDGGVNWVLMRPGTGAFSPVLVIDPLAPTTLYLAGGWGLFKTIDGGSTWNQLPTVFGGAVALAVDPQNPSNLYAGTTGDGVYRSTNGGATWLPSTSGPGNKNVLSLVVDPANGTTVYAGTLAGVYVSYDSGATWQPVPEALPADPSIRGLVNAVGGPLLAGVTVQVYDATGSFAASAITDAAGTYAVAGLPDGSYFVRTLNSAGYVDQLHAGLSCAAGCVVTSGTPVPVAGGATTIVNFALTSLGRIAGIVTGAGGVGLMGVNVQLFSSTGMIVSTVNTGAGGAYSFTGLADGTYFLRTSNTLGYGDQLYSGIPCAVACPITAGTPIVVTLGSTMTIDFALTQGATIAGTVTNVVGQPVAGAFVQILTPPFNAPAGFAITNPAGQYTVGGLAGGTYSVLVTAGGYVSQQAPVAVAAGGTATANFVLQALGGITGRVTSAAGAGIPGVQVLFFPLGSFFPAFIATTSATGHYASPLLNPGIYFARTQNSAGYVDQLYLNISCATFCNPASGTPIFVGANTLTGGIDFQLEPAPRVMGRVTDAVTGTALPGIAVAIFNESGALASSGFTDASGNYASSNLTPGTYYARTSSAPGFVDQLYSGVSCASGCIPTTGTPIVVQPNQPTVANFALSPSGRISGNVRSADTGQALAGLGVLVYDSSGTVQTSTTTDASGNYTAATNLTTGSYFVKTTNNLRLVDEVFNDRPCLNCDVTTGDPVPVTQGLTSPGINFLLGQGGTIRGTLTKTPGGTPVFFGSVDIFDSAGVFVTSASTDGSGNYATVAGLPAGDYYARTRNGLGLRDTLYDNVPCTFGGCAPLTGAKITVPAGGTVFNINLVLPDMAQITGTIRDAATTLPLSGGRVTIYTTSGIPMGVAFFSAANGSYAVKGLPAGTYYAVASRTGYKQQAFDGVGLTCIGDGCAISGTPIVVTDGATVGNVNFALGTAGRIRGRTLDAATQAPLSFIAAEIYDAAGVLVSRTTSDASGNYVSDAALPDGTYFLRTRNTRGYVDELYDSQACANCDPTAGSPIQILNGVTAPASVDIALAPGAKISGTIVVNGRQTFLSFGNLFETPGAFVTTAPTDGSGNYVAGSFATVNIFDSTGAYVTSTNSDPSGNYSTRAGLPNGTYYAVTVNSMGLLDEAFNNIPCSLNCSPFSGTPIVIDGANVNGVNFDLSRAGRIAGSIRDAVTGLPLRNVWLDVLDASNTRVATAYSTVSGAYITNGGLPTGSYSVRTRSLAGYRPSNGIVVLVTAPQTTSGVDFMLTPGAPQETPVITWANPADITYPTALSGAQLNATANVPGTFDYTPGAGTVLTPGSGQVLSVTFTPADPDSYTTATASVLINVLDPPLAVTVVSPNGGEKAFVGVPFTVNWSASGGTGGHASSFDVALSTDGGATYTGVAGCAALPGSATSCTFTPAAAAATAFIRVTGHDASGATAVDVSDASFRIAAGTPALSVKTPNTALTWAVGTANDIKWTHNLGLSSFVSIELSRDGGASWQTLAASVENATATTGAFSWTVTGPVTTAALVKITSLDTLATDVSDVTFAIADPALTITAPNSAVTWRAGTVHNITFTHNLGVDQPVDLAVSRDGGATWQTIATTATTSTTAGKYAWTVTGPETTHALVRATWSGHPTVTDVSDVEFIITPRIKITLPKTAVVWGGGSTRTVTWNHNLAASDTVDIDFSADGGTTWTRVATAVANATATTGTYTGRMPATETTQGVLRVSLTGAPAESDVTDVPITIAAPSIAITAPAAGQKFGIGSAKNVKWTHNLGADESVRVEVSRDGGATWELLAASVENSANTTGTFGWTVTGPAAASAVVRVTWLAGNGASGVSQPFKIQ